MFECEAWKSGTSCFRSAIDGLSTAAKVIVVVPAPPSPPPAPEQAAPTTATMSPRIVAKTGLDVEPRRLIDRRYLSLIQSHPFLSRSVVTDGPTRQRCQFYHRSV